MVHFFYAYVSPFASVLEVYVKCELIRKYLEVPGLKGTLPFQRHVNWFPMEFSGFNREISDYQMLICAQKDKNSFGKMAKFSNHLECNNNNNNNFGKI